MRFQDVSKRIPRLPGRRPVLVAGLAAAMLLPGLVPARAAGATPAVGTGPRTAAVAAGNLRLQGLLDELVADGATGVLAVVSDGRRIWRQASGVARLDPSLPLTTAARFRIGSVTKSFIATVALQLVGEGRLRLDDPVDRWLPWLVPGGTQIDLRMLLNHTSGLYDYTEDPVVAQRIFTDPTRGMSPRQLVGVATSYPPLFPPGTAWSYSNTNYILVGLMVEAATGRTVHELVQQRITGPLRLAGTTFPAHDRDVRGYHAHGYRPPALTGAGYLDVTRFAPSLAWTAGAIVSTADDLRRFYAALLGGRLLRPAQLAQMLTTVPVVPVFGYGLGIASQRGPCGTAWGHTGGIPGYLTVALSDRGGRRSAVLMMSTDADPALGSLLQLTAETAVCQMFGRVPPDVGSSTWRVDLPTRARGGSR
jgi:D-alanyl-D-alanine carboxypeptidase